MIITVIVPFIMAMGVGLASVRGDDLGYMMENVGIELGYYDDPDEDK